MEIFDEAQGFWGYPWARQLIKLLTHDANNDVLLVRRIGTILDKSRFGISCQSTIHLILWVRQWLDRSKKPSCFGDAPSFWVVIEDLVTWAKDR